MNQNNRICKIQGHEKYSVFHICTLMDCNEATRWCCPECFAKGVHNHNKSNNSHILNTYELQIKLANDYEKLKKDNLDNHRVAFQKILQNIKKACEMLEQSIINYKKQVEEQINLITPDADQAKMEQYLCYLRDNNLDQLDDLKINELLKISQGKVIQNNDQFLFVPLNNIKSQLGYIQLIIEDYQAKQNSQLHQNVAIKDIKYNIQVVDNSTQIYCASSISNNQQYLAYGGLNCLLKIFDIKLGKIIKEIKLQNYIYVCQFTKDSSLLFIGLHGGSVIGYDVKHDFKELYQHRIHTIHVYNLLTIENDYLITCSYDQTIIKTEIKTNKQLFILQGHTSYILGLDYNEKDQIIVSGSNDRSIKLWDCCNSSIIINKFKSHNYDIRQVQFIMNNQNILSLDISGIINKWEIDLKKNDLIKIQSFSDNNKILNFCQVNQNQNLLIICKGYFKILNHQGELQNQIEHKGDINSYPLDCRQLDNLKMIQIRTTNQIILAIAQD